MIESVYSYVSDGINKEVLFDTETLQIIVKENGVVVSSGISDGPMPSSDLGVYYCLPNSTTRVDFQGLLDFPYADPVYTPNSTSCGFATEPTPIVGCMDPEATNYDPTATSPGTCTYPASGEEPAPGPDPGVPQQPAVVLEPTTVVLSPDELSLVLNPVEYKLKNTTALADAAFIVMKLFVESEAGSSVYKKIAEYESERDPDNNAAFDVAEDLKAHLQYFISSADTPLQICKQLCKRYFVEYGFRTGPEAIHADIRTSGTAGFTTLVNLTRHLREGKVYHLIVDADAAVAGQIRIKYTAPSGVVTLASPAIIGPYKGKTYMVFTPAPAEQFAYQQIRVPNQVQVTVYTNFAPLTTSAAKYTHLAGWHHTVFPVRASLLPGNRKILQTLPAQQRVINGQWLYLHYLPYADEAINLRLVVSYADGSNAETTVALGNALKFQPVFIPLPAATALPGYVAGKQFTQIQVYMNADLLQTLYREETNSSYIREFHYANSLGGFNPLVCTGKGEDSMGFKRETASRILPRDYLPDQGTDFVYANTGRSKGRAATGFFTSKTEYKAHLGLFLSSDVRIRIGNRLFPVIIDTKSVTYQKDGEHLVGFEFDYTFAFDELALQPVE